MVRIVLDTNVLIDADKGEGSYPKRILNLVSEGQVEAVISDPVRREQELIAGKLMKDPVLMRAVREYLAKAKEVSPASVRIRLEDEEDIKLLAAVAGGEAGFLVTADRHLLDVGEYQGCRILTPSAFWRFWESQDGGQRVWSSWVEQVLGK